LRDKWRFRVDPTKQFQQERTPGIPPVDQELMVPQPLELYSVPPATEAKAEKQGSHSRRRVARQRPNFFGKFVAGFIKLQKTQPVK
jgi:hypothetical protein